MKVESKFSLFNQSHKNIVVKKPGRKIDSKFRRIELFHFVHCFRFDCIDSIDSISLPHSADPRDFHCEYVDPDFSKIIVAIDSDPFDDPNYMSPCLMALFQDLKREKQMEQERRLQMMMGSDVESTENSWDGVGLVVNGLLWNCLLAWSRFGSYARWIYSYLYIYISISVHIAYRFARLRWVLLVLTSFDVAKLVIVVRQWWL